MTYTVRIKIGFYETKYYNLSVENNMLLLHSADGNKDKNITIPYDQILVIILSKNKFQKIEIQTREKIYQGNLDAEIDFEPLLKSLKDNLHKKIIYEYESIN